MLISPLILDRLITLWFGDGGTMKSYIGLAAAASLGTGLSILGSLRPVDSQRRRVLYCDFELDGWTHLDRLEAIMGSESDVSEWPDIEHLECEGTFLMQWQRIQRQLHDKKCDFMIIDSVSASAHGSLNDDEVATQYCQKVRSLKVPALLIAHVAKNGNGREPFGSIHWKNPSRLAWQFVATETDDGVDLLLSNQKHTLGRKPTPLALNMRFQPGLVTIKSVAAPKLHEAQELLGILERQGEGMTLKELAIASGKEWKAVEQIIRRAPSLFQAEKDGKANRFSAAQPKSDIRHSSDIGDVGLDAKGGPTTPTHPPFIGVSDVGPGGEMEVGGSKVGSNGSGKVKPTLLRLEEEEEF
jgi:hypothetical protein